MGSNSSIDNANQDIPLHTFRTGLETTHEEIPLEYLNFSDAPALTQSANPHRHNFYEVFYITGGMGTHYIDFNAYPIEPNTFYFISPGQVHYWNTTIPIEGEILIFMDDFLLLAPADYMVLHELSFFHTVEGSPTLQLDESDHLQVMSLLRAIAEEFKTYDFRSASVLRSYLHILLVQTQRIYAIQEAKAGNGQDKIAQKLTRQFKKLVTKQFVTGQSVQEYADQLGVSVNHLNKTVKDTTGRTPGQLIRQEIILEAKRLFQHTDLTATEIGYRLAFDDPSYFGRFFKREVGVSPGQFRQNMSGSTL
jgi:AraC-like DNA-binding protein/mannose-6-phosphate isomerase-like protein (cupin superfamily)